MCVCVCVCARARVCACVRACLLTACLCSPTVVVGSLVSLTKCVCVCSLMERDDLREPQL